MNNPDSIPTDSDDEPESPVFCLELDRGSEAELIIADQRWTDMLDNSFRGQMAAAMNRCLKTQEIRDVGLSVLLADDAELASLNQGYRGKDEATNVLSFPDDDRASLGDIAIAFDTVVREASELGKTAQNHLLHLVIHGVLHLLGHDHLDDDEAAVMEGIETEILAEFGISDPYQEAP